MSNERIVTLQDSIESLRKKMRVGVWNVIDEDDPRTFPKPNKMVILSFMNDEDTDVGYYWEDEEGGSFHDYLGNNFARDYRFVNAWMPYPTGYKED